MGLGELGAGVGGAGEVEAGGLGLGVTSSSGGMFDVCYALMPTNEMLDNTLN